MIERLEVLTRILESGLIAIVRADSPDQALKVADACRAGGAECIEITMTVPGAVEVIRELTKAFTGDELVFGAGTVLDPETARLCILAGARFLVSPNLNLDTMKMAHRYGKVAMPGTYSPTEIVQAMEYGADIVKIFPGSLGGPEMVKAIRGPLPEAPLCPTGGVSLGNVADWITAGAVAVGVGTELTKGARTGDYGLVTATAQEFVSKIRAARGGK